MYYIIYGLLYLISLLPFFILYGISNFAYFIIYYVIGYRKKVVLSNLEIAFPEKTAVERNRICKQFYKNLVDTFIETIKLLSISEKSFSKRVSMNFDEIHALTAKGKNIQLHSGHQMNWEYAHWSVAKNIRLPWIGIYMKISNKSINRLFLKIRLIGPTVLVAAQEFKSRGTDVFSNQYSLGLIGDQNPGNPQAGYWLNFFNRPVPFAAGPDKGAIKNNTAVVFVKFTKLKRGHYIFEPKIITEAAGSLKNGELTLIYRDFLEASIREQPDNYLWSHRRWRWTWKAEYEKNWIDNVPAPTV
ncbi:MAG: lipid A biosynthesis acyltransferase [Ferruginibacter sp.]